MRIFNLIRKFTEIKFCRIRTSYIDNKWTAEDFAYDGTVIAGFSSVGMEKLQKCRDLALPDKNLNGEHITAVGKSAFSKSGIKTIRFPEGLRGVIVGQSAFSENEIEKAYIPEGISEIDAGAFYKNRLKYVEIPGTVWKIGNMAFAHNNIESLNISNDVESIHIDNYSFSNNCIREVRLPFSVFKIKGQVFMNNPGTVYMYTENPEHFAPHKYIFQSEYQKLIALGHREWTLDDFTYEGTAVTGFSGSGKSKFEFNKELVLPEKNPQGEPITAIGVEAFKMAEEKVVFKGDSAYSTEGLISVVIPGTVQRIEAGAFRYNRLASLDIPNGVKAIGDIAFSGNQLRSLVMPPSITSLGSGAFSLNLLEALEISPNIADIPKAAFARNINLNRIEIPEGVVTVGEYAFNGDPITSLGIPKTLRRIQSHAFAYHRLSELEIPGTVKEIGSSAFSANPKFRYLEKLVLNEGTELIGAGAFKDNLISKVKLPSSLRRLDKTAFLKNLDRDKNEICVKLHSENRDHIEFEESAYHEVALKDRAIHSDDFANELVANYA